MTCEIRCRYRHRCAKPQSSGGGIFHLPRGVLPPPRHTRLFSGGFAPRTPQLARSRGPQRPAPLARLTSAFAKATARRRALSLVRVVYEIACRQVELEFQIEPGDIDAFLDHHSQHSAALREIRRRQRYGYVILLGIFGLVFWIFGETAVAIAILVLGPCGGLVADARAPPRLTASKPRLSTVPRRVRCSTARTCSRWTMRVLSTSRRTLKRERLMRTSGPSSACPTSCSSTPARRRPSSFLAAASPEATWTFLFSSCGLESANRGDCPANRL